MIAPAIMVIFDSLRGAPPTPTNAKTVEHRPTDKGKTIRYTEGNQVSERRSNCVR
jgi:hypothetical protein